MNLTLKQLFKFAAVCACACALNATATDYVSDSFEVPDGSLDLPIGEYKAEDITNGLGQVVGTNYAWVAQSGDASTIVSNDAAYADISGDGPIAGGTAELILNLETEGNTLSRTGGVAYSESTPIYVDTLIQFTPSEDEPEIDTTDVKVAAYVNAQSNLVVVHNVYTDPAGFDYSTTETNSVITSVGAIDPDKWYRLTLAVVQSGFGDKGTEIYLDGVQITHANAFDVDGNVNGGPNATLFINIDTSLAIDMISFQGTGLLDELVVTDTEPDFGSTAIELTLFSADGKTTFSPVGPVESGTEVTMTADDWYRIDSVTGPIDQDVSGLLPASSIVTTLTATASCTVTVETAVVTNTVTGIGGNSYDAYMVATWALNNGVAETNPLDAALEDDYLLNVAPGTDSGIQIDSITVSGTTATIVVSVTDTAVNLDNINGTLKLYSSTTVDGTYTEVGSATVGSGDDSVQIDITGVANPTDFFKAVVE